VAEQGAYQPTADDAARDRATTLAVGGVVDGVVHRHAARDAAGGGAHDGTGDCARSPLAIAERGTAARGHDDRHGRGESSQLTHAPLLARMVEKTCCRYRKTAS
jgi:hypothetical protein